MPHNSPGTRTSEVSRAIYLVANKRSSFEVSNLVLSIRGAGCNLPICLIPFGGEPLTDGYTLREVNILHLEDFPKEAIDFLTILRKHLKCPDGFLRRFLAFFGPYDQFLYSDNDVVALCNWTKLFDLQIDSQILHCDEEYTTEGKFNFTDVNPFISEFGTDALTKALTAGHFVARKNADFLNDLIKALEWMSNHQNSCNMHDQTLLHVAVVMGSWKCTNLCKQPHSWLSPWSGDHRNALSLVHNIQDDRKISHLHYSGRSLRYLHEPIDEFLFSNLSTNQRLRRIAIEAFRKHFGLSKFDKVKKKLLAKVRR